MTTGAIHLPRPLPKRLLQALAFGIVSLVLSYVVPYGLTRHHAQPIRYCTNAHGPKSIWFGTFGSGAAVLCNDGTTEDYYGRTRTVDDDTQIAILPQVDTISVWARRVSIAIVALMVLLLIRWHWRE